MNGENGNQRKGVKNKIQSDDWGALVSIFDSISSYVYFKSGYWTIKEHSNHFLVRTLGQYIDIPLSSIVLRDLSCIKKYSNQTYKK